MKNGFKRVIAMMAVVVMIIGSIAVGQPWFGITEASAATTLASGTVENGLLWEINSDGVLKISGNGSLSDCSWYGYTKEITGIVIGEGITEIDHGFGLYDGEYPNCTSVTISSTVEEIGAYSFNHLPISSIKVHTDNKRFCDIDGILFSADKKTLYCYPSNKSGTNYTIPATVKTIVSGAFYGSQNLISVDYAEGASFTEIKSDTFADCAKLTSIKLPNSVYDIDVTNYDTAFHGSYNLKELVFDSGASRYVCDNGILRKLREEPTEDGLVFKPGPPVYCLPGIVECVFTEDMYYWGNHEAFKDCDNLSKFTVEENNSGLADINGCLYSKDGDTLILCPNAMTEIKISSSAASIGDDFYEWEAFAFCGDIVESISVEEGNTSFCVENGTLYSSDKSTIYLCAETMPIIEATVTSIRPYSFIKPKLVLFKGTEAQWNAIQNDNWFNYYDHVIYNFVDDGSGVVANGTCGDNLEWTLDQNGQLTISGSGNMTTFNSYSNRPGWGEYCSIIENVVVKDGVTSLGSYAFYGTGLNRYVFSSISLPDTLKKIESRTFGYQSNISSVTIPSSVETIEDYAFWCCYNLTNISVESNSKLKSIGEGAFYNSDISEITVPKSVTTLTGFPFATCNSLESIYVESGNEHFASVDGVLYTKDLETLVCYPGGKTEKTFTVPNTVNFIADYAFRNNDYIRSVVLPSSVTSIGMKSFWRCSNLTSVTIPETMKYIGKSAFVESPLKDIYFGGTNEQWNSIGIDDEESGYVAIKSATIHCNGESDNAIDYNYNLLDDGTLEITFYLGAGGDVIVPSEINGYKVSTIADFAFCDDANIKSVVLPETVKKIETGAFYYCTGLETLYVGSKDLDVRKGAFYESGLSDVYYSGTESEWAKISVADYNTEIQNADVHCEKEELVVRNDLHNIFLKGSAWEEAIDRDTVLNVNVVDENTEAASAVLAVAEELSSDYALYDITLTKDGERIQPTSSVEVSIPLSDDLAHMECSVYNINKDGAYKNMNALRSENTMTFVTDHFSYYAVVGSAPARVPGDINGDGKISMLDSTVLRRYLANWSGVTINEANADVNSDGKVDMKDSVILRRYLAGWDGVELR